MLPGVDVSVSGLGSGPHTECSGVPLEPERWYCLQAHVTEGAQRLAVSVSLDGEPLVDRDFTDLAAAWMGSDLYLKLGQAAYGPAGAGAIW